MFDYHLHSEYSDDSWYDMEQVVIDAIAKGLKEICFCDHVDYGVKLDWDDPRPARLYHGEEVRNVNYPDYFSRIEMLQKKYSGQITIRKGLEFGIQMHTIHEFNKLIDNYPMDFVLLSIHQINDKEFWLNDYQTGKSVLEIYEGYYEEMLSLVKNFKDYSCLAHMDLVRRYVEDPQDMFYENKEIIKNILETVIEDGKGIEINTSNVRYGIDGLTPSLEILKLYKQMGGKIITVGSDSHKPEHLGFNILESYQILRELGFESVYTFESMQPIAHKLDTLI